MPTRRQEKVARVVKEAVSDGVRSLNDPRIEGFISVTRVEMAPNLRNAEVFFSIFGSNETAQKKTFIAITHATSRIQWTLAARIKSKFCPILKFHMDEEFKKTLETMRLIEQAVSEIKDKDSTENQDD